MPKKTKFVEEKNICVKIKFFYTINVNNDSNKTTKILRKINYRSKYLEKRNASSQSGFLIFIIVIFMAPSPYGPAKAGRYA